MAKTNAERQAAYRNTRFSRGTNGNGERRLNTWLSTGASMALERLARREGITQREYLERVLTAADDANLAALGVLTPEWNAYFGT
jgi:hypothetical protein